MNEARFDTKLKLIEKAALEVFLERGFEHTTLEAVAERLGYTKQAIYYYYKSKEALVASFCVSILSKSKEDIGAICGSQKTPEEKIRDLVRYTLNGSSLERGFFTLHNGMKGILSRIHDPERVAEISRMISEIPAMIMDTIREGVDSGCFRSGDPYTLSLIIAGMLNGIILTLDAQTGRGAIDPAAYDIAAEIILKGISR